MADITFTTKTVKDGGGADVTTQLYDDGNHSNANGPVSAIILKDGSLLAFGQGVLAASLPVAIASDQTKVPVHGDVAHDSPVSGAPVRIAGKANSSAPASVAAGDVCDVWTTVGGAVCVAPLQASNVGDAASAARLWLTNNGATDGAAAVCTTAFNGSTWDRFRTNHEATAFASAARTASSNSSDLTNYNARGVKVVIDVTAASATPSVVFTIAGKCTLSGKYYAILASAAITGTGTTVLTVYPGATAAANVAVSDVLPRLWRVEAVHADADSITYSVSVNYVL